MLRVKNEGGENNLINSPQSCNFRFFILGITFKKIHSNLKIIIFTYMALICDVSDTLSRSSKIKY